MITGGSEGTGYFQKLYSNFSRKHPPNKHGKGGTSWNWNWVHSHNPNLLLEMYKSKIANDSEVFNRQENQHDTTRPGCAFSYMPSPWSGSPLSKEVPPAKKTGTLPILSCQGVMLE